MRRARIAAAIADFDWFRLEIPPSVANARVNSAKYSAGPNSRASLTRTGASRTKPQVAKKLPTNDDTPDSASASPALPCLAIG